ncbi:glutamic-type intramembrane protease PrsW [Pontibacillus sp. HMF3514]|uniref:glutamic-type intramembrane protease PrsW n=1 Tax=Pontibacillus sp. HMF3514 TaxID=2692425 RepID=UPI0013202600|nr:glutamic-type intramembrane protease PrsW [Pontibacillus sp. HMF3514]QHE52539.1 intramembrane metalloprotease PrsW [Pontibacillus sp. HMF3514]
MFTLLSAAIAPGLSLMSFFYLKDRFDHDPISMIIRTFIMGALLVFPIMFIQYAFETEGVAQAAWSQSFLLSGSLEEFFKWFIFLYVVYKHTSFNGHYDGILYGVSISLGFATIENILYLLANGIEVAVGRAFFPVSSHALFGVLMGYYMGKAKTSDLPSKKSKLLVVSLLLPIILHGFYDLILEMWSTYWIYILTPFMILLWLLALRKVKKANEYRNKVVPIEKKKWNA